MRSMSELQRIYRGWKTRKAMVCDQILHRTKRLVDSEVSRVLETKQGNPSDDGGRELAEVEFAVALTEAFADEFDTLKPGNTFTYQGCRLPDRFAEWPIEEQIGYLQERLSDAEVSLAKSRFNETAAYEGLQRYEAKYGSLRDQEHRVVRARAS